MTRSKIVNVALVQMTCTQDKQANVDKALTFLDDRLLPSTSNAVERGNRRHRKMQKTVYRVRTCAHIHERMALDLFREARASARGQTLHALHHARAAPRQLVTR